LEATQAFAKFDSKQWPICTRAHVHNEIKTFRQVAKRKKYSEEAKQVRCEE